MAFAAFSLINYLLQKLGIGVDINAQFELTMAVAIGTGLAFDRAAVIPLASPLSAERKRLGIVAILSLWLIAAPGIEPYLLVVSPDYRALFRQYADLTAAEVRRIAAIPGPVTCQIRTICRWAGKGFNYDAASVRHKIETGRLTKEQLNARLDEQGIRYENNDLRTSAQPLSRQLIYGRSGP